MIWSLKRYLCCYWKIFTCRTMSNRNQWEWRKEHEFSNNLYIFWYHQWQIDLQKHKCDNQIWKWHHIKTINFCGALKWKAWIILKDLRNMFPAHHRKWSQRKYQEIWKVFCGLYSIPWKMKFYKELL